MKPRFPLAILCLIPLHIVEYVLWGCHTLPSPYYFPPKEWDPKSCRFFLKSLCVFPFFKYPRPLNFFNSPHPPFDTPSTTAKLLNGWFLLPFYTVEWTWFPCNSSCFSSSVPFDAALPFTSAPFPIPPPFYHLLRESNIHFHLSFCLFPVSGLFGFPSRPWFPTGKCTFPFDLFVTQCCVPLRPCPF